jgi:hypothetical protein
MSDRQRLGNFHTQAAALKKQLIIFGNEALEMSADTAQSEGIRSHASDVTRAVVHLIHELNNFS